MKVCGHTENPQTLLNNVCGFGSGTLLICDYYDVGGYLV